MCLRLSSSRSIAPVCIASYALSGRAVATSARGDGMGGGFSVLSSSSRVSGWMMPSSSSAALMAAASSSSCFFIFASWAATCRAASGTYFSSGLKSGLKRFV